METVITIIHKDPDCGKSFSIELSSPESALTISVDQLENAIGKVRDAARNYKSSLAGKKYFGSWSDYQGMKESWEHEGEDFPKEESILFASYGGGSYEGDATVIYTLDGSLYENHGLHCSCYGLENQWRPEKTTRAALVMKGKKDQSGYYFLSDHEDEAYTAYWALVDRLSA